MRSLSCRAAVAVAVLLVGASIHAATVEEIQKDLIAKRETCKSLSFDQTIEMEMKNDQMSMTSKGTGTFETLKKGGKYLTRMESSSTGEQKMMGQTVASKITTLMVYDGEFAYNYMDMNGMKQATKSKPTKAQEAGDDWIAAMKDDFDFKVLPDEKVEGEDCYVLQLVPKDKEAAGTDMNYWIAKSSGVPVKVINKMPGGGAMTMTAKNIKLNPSIAEDRFVFKAPEGVQVMDMSKMGAGEGGE